MTTNQNNNGDKAILVAFILAIILLFLLTSCSTRKVEATKEKQIEKVEIETKETIDTKINETTKVIDTSTTNEIEYVPINDTLPFIVNGQVFKNVRIKHLKKKNNISIDKTIKMSKNEQKAVKNNSIKKTLVIEKEIERTSLNWWWLLLLIIPVGYYLYRKHLFGL